MTQAAFRGHPHSEQTEAYIVQLRAAGALTLSLVAELDARVVGHAAFSPVQISDGSPSWFGLGPVSVDPAHQGRGIGTALIEHGLARLQARGAAGCVLVGEPAYYGRFGFRPEPGLVLPDMPPTHFLALTFGAPRAAPSPTIRDSRRATHNPPGPTTVVGAGVQWRAASR